MRKDDIRERHSQTIVDAIDSLESHPRIEAAAPHGQSNIVATGMMKGLTEDSRSPDFAYVVVSLISAYTDEQYREPIEEALSDFQWEREGDSWQGRTNFQVMLRIKY